jgi:hypothetical protein
MYPQAVFTLMKALPDPFIGHLVLVMIPSDWKVIDGRK